jgi:hypothetical protein
MFPGHADADQRNHSWPGPPAQTFLEPFNPFLKNLNLFPELIDFLDSTGWILFAPQEATEEQETECSSSQKGFHQRPPWGWVNNDTRKVKLSVNC